MAVAFGLDSRHCSAGKLQSSDWNSSYLYSSTNSKMPSSYSKSLLDHSSSVTVSDSVETRRRMSYTSAQTASFREGFSLVTVFGSYSIRFLGFIASSAALVLGLTSLWHTILMHPLDLGDNILLIIVAISASMIELTSFKLCNCLCCARLRFRIEYWAKFLTRAWGKFIIYELIASLLVSWRTWHNIPETSVGLANATVGVLYLFYSIYGSAKLRAVRKEAMQVYKNHFEDLFEKADENGDGYVSHHELDILAENLGMNLNPNEIQVMVNYLDKDRDGKLSLAEFKLWFEQNKLPTLL